MGDFAREEIGDGRKPDMVMRPDVDLAADAGGQIERPHVIEEIAQGNVLGAMSLEKYLNPGHLARRQTALCHKRICRSGTVTVSRDQMRTDRYRQMIDKNLTDVLGTVQGGEQNIRH